jgi:hypothetical protein
VPKEGASQEDDRKAKDVAAEKAQRKAKADKVASDKAVAARMAQKKASEAAAKKSAAKKTAADVAAQEHACKVAEDLASLAGSSAVVTQRLEEEAVRASMDAMLTTPAWRRRRRL